MIVDVRLISIGKYEISDDSLILIYGDENIEKTVFKIVKITKDKIILRYFSNNKAGRKIIFYKSIK